MDMINQFLYQTCLVLFAGFLVWAALTDHRDFLIPNRIVVAIALLYPAFVLTSPVVVDWAYGAMVASIVLGATASLFGLGVMGGGDAKLMAATALWTGPGLILPFLKPTARTSTSGMSPPNGARPWSKACRMGSTCW